MPPTGGPVMPMGEAVSREAALQMIATAADYFRRMEPHSPTAWVLDTVLRRSRMTFPDLLADLLGDAPSRQELLTAAGVKLPNAAEE